MLPARSPTPRSGGGEQTKASNLVLGGVSGTFAATVCYPLDTIRRRMQMKGKTYSCAETPLPPCNEPPVAAARARSVARSTPSALSPTDPLRPRRPRRRGMGDAIVKIARAEGAAGFFRGWSANTLKVAPMSAIRFVSYEVFKGLLNVKRAQSDT